MRVEQTEVIVNLRRRRDDRRGTGAGTALFDGDRGGKSFDEIHLRLLHLVEELPRIGGKRFDIFALAFGVNRIEGERRLARTAQTGDDHQFVARDLEREIFEIMLTRAANFDEFFAHAVKILRLHNR